MTADPVTFVVADGPSAAVATPSDGGAGGAHLAGGEAVAVLADAGFDVVAASPEGGSIVGVAIAPGLGDGTFTPGAGTRDVDLVRDVLNTNEALIVHAEVSAFVVVTAGAVDAAGTTIAAGSGAAMTGVITLINVSPDVATVLVAVVVDLLQQGGEPGAVAEVGVVQDAWQRTVDMTAATVRNLLAQDFASPQPLRVSGPRARTRIRGPAPSPTRGRAPDRLGQYRRALAR